MYQNSKLKSEIQNSYGFENELNELVSSLDESLRWPLFGIIFDKKEVEYHKTCFFGILGEYWRGPWGTGSAKFYSSGNRRVKKWPGERGPWCSPWHPCLDETKLKKLFYPNFFYKSSIHPNIILIYLDRVWNKIRIKSR